MSDCIFCKIINGDFGTEFVYENDSTVVFKDINPKADTHLLVIPRLHVESLNELDDKYLVNGNELEQRWDKTKRSSCTSAVQITRSKLVEKPPCKVLFPSFFSTL